MEMSYEVYLWICASVNFGIAIVIGLFLKAHIKRLQSHQKAMAMEKGIPYETNWSQWKRTGLFNNKAEILRLIGGSSAFGIIYYMAANAWDKMGK